ncbi:hypothetical protein ACLMJK_006955 [Lecanora helva]
MSITSSENDTSALIEQIASFRQKNLKDAVIRQALYDAARKLSFEIETPGDAINRIAYSPLQNSVACTASDIGVFEILTSKEHAVVRTDELAVITKADASFLGRLLRYLASFGMIQELAEDTWSASNITRTLSVPAFKAGLHHHQHSLMPAYQALPEFLAETRYQNPSDSANSPFQKGHATDLLPWIWLQTKPANRDAFGQWIGASHEIKNVFLDVFPFERELCTDTKPETPLFIDIGGGFGHQCMLVRKRFPNTLGRVILQDLPEVIAQVPPVTGVEPMAHNFLTEQPIKGARAYYLRNIMHDNPDDKCILILQHIVKAMGRDSVIILDDMIIPNKGANWRATQLDLTMMSGLAGVERTERQWYKLMDNAGLKIQKVYTYTTDLGDSVIIAVPK